LLLIYLGCITKARVLALKVPITLQLAMYYKQSFKYHKDEEV